MSEFIRVNGSKNHQDFTDYDAMADYLGHRLSGNFSLVIGLGRSLTAQVVGTELRDQTVAFTDGPRRVTVPRRTELRHEGVVVAPQSGQAVSLHVHAGEYDSPWLNHGLAEVKTYSHAPDKAAILMATLPEHGLSEAGLATVVSDAVEKSRALVDAILNEQPLPPYALYSERSLQLRDDQEMFQRLVQDIR